MYLNKIKHFLIILILTLCSLNKIFTSTIPSFSGFGNLGNQPSTTSSSSTGTQPASTTSPTSITRRTNIAPENFKLSKNIIDISAIFEFSFRSSQVDFTTGISGSVFIHPLVELGAKFSLESFKTYGYVLEFQFMSRIFFLKEGSSIPFFYLDGGYGYGSKLQGLNFKAGFGVLQHVIGVFNINLGILFDFWYFTHRFNSGDSVSESELKFDKTNIDFRVIIGFNFFIKG